MEIDCVDRMQNMCTDDVKKTIWINAIASIDIFIGSHARQTRSHHLAVEPQLVWLEDKLLKIDEMYVNGDLEKDSYQRVKASNKAEIIGFKRK